MPTGKVGLSVVDSSRVESGTHMGTASRPMSSPVPAGIGATIFESVCWFLRIDCAVATGVSLQVCYICCARFYGCICLWFVKNERPGGILLRQCKSKGHVIVGRIPWPLCDFDRRGLSRLAVLNIACATNRRGKGGATDGSSRRPTR